MPSELTELITLIRSVVDEPDRSAQRLADEYRRQHQISTARRARLDRDAAEILRWAAPSWAP